MSLEYGSRAERSKIGNGEPPYSSWNLPSEKKISWLDKLYKLLK